jgi:hypothetical protein
MIVMLLAAKTYQGLMVWSKSRLRLLRGLRLTLEF